jgi:hypothetical protein
MKLFHNAVVLLLAIFTFTVSVHSATFADNTVRITQQETGLYESILAEAYTNHTSNLQVRGQGMVVKLLPDDNDNNRHQRFIIKLSSGQTLLIAHNVDIAPRIESLHVGDIVGFYGEYEWNEFGGVLHWTHRDPDGSHISGWLRHAGRIYQ